MSTSPEPNAQPSVTERARTSGHPAAFSVFLSYASEDRIAAQRLFEKLRDANIEVWLDIHELRGGDAWDNLIRQQIKACTFFVPLISETTRERTEGYFRREWKLAIERSHDIADDRPFILPAALANIPPEVARVPQTFLSLQWINLPDGTQGERLVERLEFLHRKLNPGSTPGEASQRGGPAAGAPLPAGFLPANAPLPADSPRAGAHSRPRRRSRWISWIIVAATVALAAAGWRWHAGPPAGGSDDDAGRITRSTVEEQSVAVLPFANLTGDPQDDYLSDGLSEELLAALERDSALRIVARTSSFFFKGKSIPVQQIAAQLGVATLVEGSVRRVGGKLKVAVRLINGTTGFRIWSRDYAESSDLLSIQAALTSDVFAQLLPAIGRPIAARRPATTVLDAYDAFLRARSFQSRPPTRDNLQRAADYFRQATELDPAFAVAWAKYGAALIRLHTAGDDNDDATLRTAWSAIERALVIDPALPEAHYALAHYHTRNWTNQGLAEQELLRAKAVLPNDPDVLAMLAATYIARGRKLEATQHVLNAARLDPQNGDIANFCALILDFASQYAEAAAERERAFQIGGWRNSLLEKAWTYRNWQGDLSLALKTLDLAAPPSDTPDDNYWRVRANFLRAQKDYNGALAAVERIEAAVVPSQFHYYSKTFLRASIREAMGDDAGARSDYAQALADAERFQAANPTIVRAHTSLALIYAALGRDADARAVVDRCFAVVPPSENSYLAARIGYRLLAQVHARFNRMDEALEIVRTQIAAGFWKRHDLLLDNDWDWLRRDPRFVALARDAPL